MTTITKLKNALESLCRCKAPMYGYHEHSKAITDLRSVIAEMEAGEPCAEIVGDDMGRPFNAIQIRTHFYKEVPPIGTKLFTHPQPKAEPVQVPVAECVPLSAMRAIAVEAIRAITGCPDIKGNDKYLSDEIESVAKAATIAQPKAEPVQQQEFTNRLRELCGLHSGDHPAASMRQREFIRDFAPKGQPKAEPALCDVCGFSIGHATACPYNHNYPQPKAEKLQKAEPVVNDGLSMQSKDWIGLTEDDLVAVMMECSGGPVARIPSGWRDMQRAIEAKLKEKNT